MPLSEAQLGIWLGHQAAADPSVYNAAQLTLFDADADPSALRRAIVATLTEATALDIAFKERQGRPCMVPSFRSSEGLDAWRQHCEAAVTGIHRVGDVLAHARAAVRVPTSPETGVLFRHELCALPDGRLAWLHLAHHIALDGFAFQLIARRVAERYAAELTGQVLAASAFTALAPVLQEDAAYALGPERKHDEQFWRALLDEAPGPAFAAPLAPNHAVRFFRNLDSEVYTELRTVCRQNGSLPVEAFLAAAAQVSGVWARCDALTLGLPSMLRLGSSALKTPCMAMNIIAVPVRQLGTQPLTVLTQQLAATVRRTRKHQRYRYEALPSLLGVERVFSPVVNIMPFAAPQRFGPTAVEGVDVSAGPVQDLSFSFIQRGNTWQIGVDGHPSLFCPADLEALVSDIELQLSRQQTSTTVHLVGTPQPTHERSHEPTSLPSWPLAAIARHAAHAPKSAAVVTSDGTVLSYRQLDAAVTRCAGLLRPRVEAGDLIALDMGRNASTVIAILATLELGCAYVALDAAHPHRRRRAIIEHAKPKLILGDSTGVGDALPAETWLLPSDLASPRAAVPDAGVCLGQRFPADASPAYVVYTSGSSGSPKGVLISAGALSHFIVAARKRYHIGSADRVLQFASLCFDASVEEIFVTLAAGATLVLRDDAMLNSTRDFCKRCAELQITVLDLPTAYFHELVRAFVCWPQLKTVIVGGEALQPSAARDFLQRSRDVRLVNSYGPSEATVVATTADIDERSLYEHAAPIGFALDGVGAVVLDGKQHSIEQPCVEGELHLTGPTLALGYLRDEVQTQQRFADVPGLGRCYRTGDRAWRNFSGQLVFAGRSDDELKIAGQRVVPAEVERVLCDHEQVTAAVVWGQPHPDLGHRLFASIEVPASGATEAELRDAARLQLPAAAIPTCIFIMARLPRSTSGKLARRQIIAEATVASVPRAGEPLAAPQPEAAVSEGALEAKLKRAWCTVLAMPSLTLDDNFFALGGSSMQAIQLVSRLFAEGLELGVTDVFRHPTLRQQLGRLKGERASPPQEAAEVFVPPPVSLTLSREQVIASKQEQSSEAQAAVRVLLTGATGFVGVYLLHELMQQTSWRVVCLVRADTNEEARARLFEQLRTHRLTGSRLPASWNQRIDVRLLPRRADAGKRTQVLGSLPNSRYLIHCAATVSLTRDYSSLQDDNVTVTRDLLSWAGQVGAEVHFISTLATVPVESLGSDDGERMFPAHAGLQDGYQQTKFHAERLCAEARELGVDVAIHRLGRVVGPRANPAINEQDIVWRIARSSVAFGQWPALPRAEPWSPVDDVAHNVLALLLGGAVHHGAAVFHPSPIS